ncbi:MAG: DUF2948 family protein [Kiloniellaceae bacterium]
MTAERKAPERTAPGAGPLKLRARDVEDLQAMAACLQDALVPLSDVAYLKPDKRFVMVANRFRWETGADRAPASPRTAAAPGGDARFEASGAAAGDGPRYERVNCGVCFDRVRKVRARGLELGRRDQILNLLTINAEPGAVTLIFSGGGAIRLEVSEIRCHLEDLGEPWPTHWRPAHPADDAAPEDRR